MVPVEVERSLAGKAATTDSLAAQPAVPGRTGSDVRQIFPVRAGESARLLGPADPLSSAGPVKPPAAGAFGDLIAELGEIYAYPDRTWVRANMVASLDGAVTVDGRSGGLSGPADRLVFSVLRSLADVVVVGAGTARAERYRQAQPDELWQQLRAGLPPAPPIAVVTRHLDLELTDRLFGPAGPKTIVLTAEQAPDDRRNAASRVADVIVAGSDSVTAASMVDALARLGHRRILVEGGPSLLGQLTAEHLLDELCLTVSPVLEGGQSAARITSSRGPAEVTGMRLAGLLEDEGFLLSRYLRA